MKKFYVLLIFISIISANNSSATVWNVTNSGFTFVPDILTITLGDTVMFNLASSHNAIEVSQSTWNSNGNTSNGGFTVPFGGGMLIPTMTKTYYYVCQPHASLGMKGQIVVNPSTGIPDNINADGIVRMEPNPASFNVSVSTGLADGIPVKLSIYDVTGKLVMTSDGLVNKQRLNISGLRKGIYFVQVEKEDYKRTTKLVVTR
jgi:plastocyanin